MPEHVQPVGFLRFCGTMMMQYAVGDVKDMGQQMGYRSLEWNERSHEHNDVGQDQRINDVGRD